MNTKTLALLGAALATAPVGAFATPTFATGSTLSDPTGVDALVVDGTTYDVSFSSVSYNAEFPSSPTFLGNSSGAGDAADSLAVAFSALGVTGIDDVACGYTSACQVNIPFAFDSSNPTPSVAYQWIGECNYSATSGCAASPWSSSTTTSSTGGVLAAVPLPVNVYQGPPWEVANYTAVWANFTPVTANAAPEIDPASASSALALLVGGLVVLRGRPFQRRRS